MFVNEEDTQVTAVAFNMEPDFKTVKIVTVIPELQGDYHITGASPVIDRGTPQVTRGAETIHAPDTDFDGNARPQGAGYDIGAFEYVAAP